MILLIKVNSALRQVPRRSFLLAPTYPILYPIPWVKKWVSWQYLSFSIMRNDDQISETAIQMLPQSLNHMSWFSGAKIGGIL